MSKIHTLFFNVFKKYHTICILHNNILLSHFIELATL